MTLEERLARLEERVRRLEYELFGEDYETASQFLADLHQELREAQEAGDRQRLQELERIAMSEYVTICERVVGA